MFDQARAHFQSILDEIRATTTALARALGVVGLMNVQYAIQGGRKAPTARLPAQHEGIAHDAHGMPRTALGRDERVDVPAEGDQPDAVTRAHGVHGEARHHAGRAVPRAVGAPAAVHGR